MMRFVAEPGVADKNAKGPIAAGPACCASSKKVPGPGSLPTLLLMVKERRASFDRISALFDL